MNVNQDRRTMYDLVRNAIGCQTAINLSGVIQSFHQDIIRLRTLLIGEFGAAFTTERLNTHPVCVMYVDKMNRLARAQHGTRYRQSYDWCEQMQKRGNGPYLPLPIFSDTATF